MLAFAQGANNLRSKARALFNRRPVIPVARRSHGGDRRGLSGSHCAHGGPGRNLGSGSSCPWAATKIVGAGTESEVGEAIASRKGRHRKALGHGYVKFLVDECLHTSLVVLPMQQRICRGRASRSFATWMQIAPARWRTPTALTTSTQTRPGVRSSGRGRSYHRKPRFHARALVAVLHKSRQTGSLRKAADFTGNQRPGLLDNEV
ncbi:hypothetical protein GGE50_004675 [Rhizobium leguminosarum]|uniref:Uncharacterized protein n=1 Tax=Rhizobium leguminosarum TaxID=384 RepID=A0A2Z4YPT8_RHILE|nr:hypothetical protein DLJ82_5640 [Rhizobium leguminosarum]MBB4330079.1 hypothetical protein [Rhizobium leguminosarum]MBB4340015.1 hypothetical protein [Rhizobium leguminosarum]MBB4355474.1 hypothetical protein [Rhizobium leguminosarum]MBB4389580.1 hypothetical protein [Rhizobium leguminosarum]